MSLPSYDEAFARARDDPGGREPEPVPDPSGQLCLMPREPYTGTRMYADTRPPAPAPAGALAGT